MTARYVIAERGDVAHDAIEARLPEVAVGESLRLTRTTDGWEVVPLRWTRMDIEDAAGLPRGLRVHGQPHGAVPAGG